MTALNESCGCSGGGSEYSSIINQSPILSGSQEAAFSPMSDSFSFLDSNDTFSSSLLNTDTNNNLNETQNNFSQNDEDKKNYSLDDIIKMSNKKSNNNINEMNNMTQPSFDMNNINSMNNGMNNSMNNGMNNTINNSMNNAMNNVMNTPQQQPNMNMRSLPDAGMMRNTPQNVNPQLQALMNSLNVKTNENGVEASEQDQESDSRFILKNFNILLIVIIGLAWSDVAKFYINRSIKFGGGNHKYYIYYALIMTVILYGTSKYLHMMN